jgi:large subunit ribosomal protein L23
MIDISRIIIKPIITEKSMRDTALGRYTFEVNPAANSYEIKKAVKEVLKVDAIKVNVINVGGKFRRYGKITGRTKSFKKAIITIKSGQKIELFES